MTANNALTLCACLCALGSLAAERTIDAHPAPPPAAAPKVQIAILLDTSSSMDGLIDQARTQLWKIVNEFSSARHEGVRPRLELALYEYGNDNLSAEGGYIRQVSPFTSELDRLSEQLFSLRTRGGSEYCGMVIQKATRNLAWSSSKDDLKLIYIAGNEPFTQGPVPYRESVKEAAGKGIFVNTLHCGPYDVGAATGWKEGAALADGSYMAIDQNRAVSQIVAPQDQELARLGTELNKTYLGYGARGREDKARQVAQDVNAATVSPSTTSTRVVSKASGLYENSAWDLVDAKREQKVKLDVLGDADLPAEMRGMSAAKRDAYVAEKAKERVELQEKINAVNAARTRFLAEERKKRGESEAGTLGAAVLESVHVQAAKRAYAF